MNCVRDNGSENDLQSKLHEVMLEGFCSVDYSMMMETCRSSLIVGLWGCTDFLLALPSMHLPD